MLGIQYSDNVAIQQISDNTFVLKINDAKVYQYLLTQCTKQFGWDRSIQQSQNFLKEYIRPLAKVNEYSSN